MAIIKPFKGIRPPQNLVEQVASRPYDVLLSLIHISEPTRP